MALYRLVARITIDPNSPNDVVAWSHGVEFSTLPTPGQLLGVWANALLYTTGGSALRAQLPGAFTRKSVELAPAAGGASVVFAATGGQLGIAGTPNPTQAAIPLIAMVAGPRGPRAGARWMLGPVGNSSANGRLTAAQQTAALTYGRGLQANLAPLGGSLVVLRAGGTDAEAVTHVQVGNSFGMVNSRRLEVTTRTMSAV